MKQSCQEYRSMRAIYEDRLRFAESVAPLTFYVGSWTSSRVGGEGRTNGGTPQSVGSRTNLVIRVFLSEP